MESTNVDIHSLSVGQTIWFIDNAKTQVDYADGTEISDYIIYPAVVERIELSSFCRGPNGEQKRFIVSFETKEDLYTHTTFYVGSNEDFNPRCFLTEEDAKAYCLYIYERILSEARETLEQAQNAVAYLETRTTVRTIPSDLGFARIGYLSEILARIGETTE